MPQIVERSLGAAQDSYFCTICDELIEDLGKIGIIMCFDEDGIYHTSCWEHRDAEREATKSQLTLWEDE